MVELLARIAGTSFCTDTADVFCFIENTETSRIFEHVHQFNKLHAETHVGLVGTETTHGFAPRQAQEGGIAQVVSADFLKEMFGHLFKERDDVVLLNERHLAVDLRELRLAIGTQVFITKALDNLEIAVHSRNHQELLQRLRALGQRVELTGIHAGRHDEVACAFGSGPDKNWRFYLQEAF